MDQFGSGVSGRASLSSLVKPWWGFDGDFDASLGWHFGFILRLKWGFFDGLMGYCLRWCGGRILVTFPRDGTADEAAGCGVVWGCVGCVFFGKKGLC